MGQCRSSFHHFDKEYKTINGNECIKIKSNEEVTPAWPQLYQIVEIIGLEEGIGNLLSRHKRSCASSRYRIQIEDFYFKQEGNQSKMLIVYPRIGVSLYQLLENRKKMGLPFKEEDVAYMTEYISRGIRELQDFQQVTTILTPLSIIFSGRDYSFKVFYLPIDTKKSNSAQNFSSINHKANDENLVKYNDNWLRYLFKIDENYHKQYVNLLSLGLIALNMLDLSLEIEDLFDLKTGEFVYKRVISRINNIKDEKLRWKIWLLTNEYHQERLEFYDEINPNYQKENYPKDILLRKTTLSFDAKYVHNEFCQKWGRRQEKNSIPLHYGEHRRSNSSYTPPNSHRTVLQSHKKVEMALQQRPQIIRFSFMNRPAQSISSSLVEKPEHEESPTVSFKEKQLELSIDRSLRTNKLKSWISQETQAALSLKDIDASTSAKLSKRIDNSQQKELPSEIKPQLASPLFQVLNDSNHDHDHSQFLQSEGQSIIFMQIQSDQQSQEAIKMDIDDFFKDIRSRNYSIHHHIQDEIAVSEPYIEKNMANSVIREESIEQSLSADEEEAEYVDEEYSSDERYEGYKKSGKRNGYGKFYWMNGEVYEGDWKENQMNGYGKLFHSLESIVYQGHWKKDKFHGRGKFYNKSIGSMNYDFDYTNFALLTNEWKLYQGDFIEDRKQGQGTLFLQNGQQFKGTFHDNLITGEGYFTKRDGTVIHGQWSNSILSSVF